jgi:metal-responsive CopG/Arc/MetJ family transcriptional regulator
MSNKSDRVHLVMPKYLKAELDKFAEERGVSMASVINDAVKDYLKQYQKQKADADLTGPRAQR